MFSSMIPLVPSAGILIEFYRGACPSDSYTRSLAAPPARLSA